MITRPARSPAAIVAIVCVAEILGMTPFSMFLALQPLLQGEWQLSNTTSGWISSAYYAGYMLAVPVLASLTDRFDARSVWLTAITFAVGGALGFSAAATGPATAVLCQALAGAGLAGTYMPGLKLMGDRIATPLRPRQVAFYTTSFSLGSSGSYFLVGQLIQDLPWRVAIAVAASGPLIAWLLVYAMLDRVEPHADSSRSEGSGRWRDVLQSGDTMRYVAAYACHMWELFGMRAWLIPFFVFCTSLHGPTFAAPTTLAAMLALSGGTFIASAEACSRSGEYGYRGSAYPAAAGYGFRSYGWRAGGWGWRRAGWGWRGVGWRRGYGWRAGGWRGGGYGWRAGGWRGGYRR